MGNFEKKAGENTQRIGSAASRRHYEDVDSSSAQGESTATYSEVDKTIVEPARYRKPGMEAQGYVYQAPNDQAQIRNRVGSKDTFPTQIGRRPEAANVHYTEIIDPKDLEKDDPSFAWKMNEVKRKDAAKREKYSNLISMKSGYDYIDETLNLDMILIDNTSDGDIDTVAKEAREILGKIKSLIAISPIYGKIVDKMVSKKVARQNIDYLRSFMFGLAQVFDGMKGILQKSQRSVDRNYSISYEGRSYRFKGISGRSVEVNGSSGMRSVNALYLSCEFQKAFSHGSSAPHDESNLPVLTYIPFASQKSNGIYEVVDGWRS